MNISAVNYRYNTPYFGGYNDEDKERRKVTTSEVATATGATGAAVTGAKTVQNGGFKMFKSSGKVGRMTQEAADAIRNVRKPLNQVKGIFPKFKQAFRNTKLDILKWADAVKDSHVLKPLLKSKAFGFAAGAVGAVMAFFVTISGLGDIANTVTEYVQG